FGAYLLLGWAVVRGDITLGQFAVFAGSAGGVAGLTNLSQYDLYLHYGVPSVLAVLELERAVEQPNIKLTGDGSAGGLPRQSIRMQDVSFCYPGQTRPVLDRLDLDIHVGHSLAIVGDNGAGKT